jgi:isoleucyl-tRNA synthetase
MQSKPTRYACVKGFRRGLPAGGRRNIPGAVNQGGTAAMIRPFIGAVFLYGMEVDKMALFKEVDLKKSVNEREVSVLDYWRSKDIANKSVSVREGSPGFIFYEGPPTANGKPGIHHVLARTLKDCVCRYKTMQGYQVKRKAGWDTHGLPVEIEVEKQLGLSSKQEIEDYGIEEFNKKCRESVFTYEKEWRRLTERIGYWIDMDDPYITLDNNYIETVWWILKRYFDEGLIYEGHKIMPYCPRCGTPLASHEVSLGYKDETIESIYVKMKLKGREGECLLVWTTTPWTLPSNVAVAVNPGFTYVKAQVDGEIYYLVKERLKAVLGEEAEILEELKGSELENLEYEQLLPFASVDRRAFFVTLADFVSMEDGTGIVHIAPAFGEDDYRVGKEYDLPMLQLVDKEGRFTDEVGEWAGRFVREADPDIIRYLKHRDRLFKRERLSHSYPYCWRCDTPLLYYARKSWYIATSKYKEKMIENNKKIEWYPPHVGEGRFGNWLENLIDWSLSRDRYWGTPLNIWKCRECGKLTSVGSRKELAELAAEEVDPEKVELHRPYVDDIHIKCECGGLMKRTPEVIDCWFDSGSMPYAQWHYPFEHSEDFDKLFPADFICEGIDQTRGWFYSLLAISSFISGEPSFKKVMVNDLVLDKNGQKMSKSRGNAVEPWTMIDRYGADATRWYLLAVSPAWTPTRFDEEGVKEVFTRFFGTLQNVYSFFTLYANIDGVDPREFHIPVAKREEIDRWIVSRLNSLVKRVTEYIEIFELTKAVREISGFVIDDLSNWYVRRCRSRFWASEMTDDKKAVYLTLYEMLLSVSKLMAPFAPYMAEDIYLNLTLGEAMESVHFEEYPKADNALIDMELEERMGVVITIVSLGRAARNKVQIKVRQPLRKILVDGRIRERLSKMEDLVKEELNIKEIEYIERLGEYVDYEVKPNYPVMGPKFGKLMKEISRSLAEADAEGIVSSISSKGYAEIALDGRDIRLEEEDVDIRILEREGFTVEMDEGMFVILDTDLSEELILEGIAREVVSKVQTMRKNNKFNITDRIRIFLASDEAVLKALDSYREYIKDETLCDGIMVFGSFEEASLDEGFVEWEINGHMARLKVERV